MEQTVLDKPEWNKREQELKNKHNKDPHRVKRVIIRTSSYTDQMEILGMKYVIVEQNQ